MKNDKGKVQEKRKKKTKNYLRSKCFRTRPLRKLEGKKKGGGGVKGKKGEGRGEKKKNP